MKHESHSQSTTAQKNADISSIFELIVMLKKEGGEDLICYAKLHGLKLSKRQAVDILAYALTQPAINQAWLLKTIKGWTL